MAIGYLERFAADYEREHTKSTPISNRPTNAPHVAVVGSGPAGLSFAGEMTRRGYAVTVFEALHEIGGVLKYGIPEFRLPNTIVEHEIKSLESQGVTFVKTASLGKPFQSTNLRLMATKASLLDLEQDFPTLWEYLVKMPLSHVIQ